MVRLLGQESLLRSIALQLQDDVVAISYLQYIKLERSNSKTVLS